MILAAGGPVVVDWTNARRGEAALDVALTWVIGATSGGPAGRVFLRAFLPHFNLEEVLRFLPAAAEMRIADENVTAKERQAVRRLVDQIAVG